MLLAMKQFISTLGERYELDAILPELLHHMGLHVYSKPQVGVKQDGVDVAAFGKIENEPKVYLFVIKSGDVDRATWEGDVQAVKPSLEEARIVYINNRIPNEYKGKPVTIVLCCGGDVNQDIDGMWSAYTKHYSDNCSFELWNGDKLSSLIMTYLLNEALASEENRATFRKSLALVDEPEISFVHFCTYLNDVFKKFSSKKPTAKNIQKTISEINISLWALFSWSRSANNLKSAIKSSERALLIGWEIAKTKLTSKDLLQKNVRETYSVLFSTYLHISNAFHEKVKNSCFVKHGLSSATRGSNIDINLKLFDYLGKLALTSIWYMWLSRSSTGDVSANFKELCRNSTRSIVHLIQNNPQLKNPIKDSQQIDICLALFILNKFHEFENFSMSWIEEIINASIFSLEANEFYPSTIEKYIHLVKRQYNSDLYKRENITKATILFPMLSIWSAHYRMKSYCEVQSLKDGILSKTNFQLWYLAPNTEGAIYNGNNHGKTLSGVPINKGPDEYLRILNEVLDKDVMENLSCVKNGFWPLILLSSYHYRFPVPPDFILEVPKLEDK